MPAINGDGIMMEIYRLFLLLFVYSLFLSLFLGVLGLCCCKDSSLAVESGGLLVRVQRLLIAVASSSCRTQAQHEDCSSWGMWAQ